MTAVYREMGEEIGDLVERKNKAYGSAFDRAGAVLQVLYPNGISPEQYTDMLGVVRVLDKLFRIASAKGAFGESPWKDIAGYGLLGAVRAAVEEEPSLSHDAVEITAALNKAVGARDGWHGKSSEDDAAF